MDYTKNKNTGIAYWPHYTITLKTFNSLTLQTVVRKKKNDIWYVQIVKESITDESLDPDPQRHLIEALGRMATTVHAVYFLGKIDLKFPELFMEDYFQIEEADRIKKAYNYLE